MITFLDSSSRHELAHGIAHAILASQVGGYGPTPGDVPQQALHQGMLWYGVLRIPKARWAWYSTTQKKISTRGSCFLAPSSFFISE